MRLPRRAEGHNGDVDDEYGICDGYEDVHHEWHPTPEPARERLRAAMGAPQQGRPMLFVQAGSAHAVDASGELRLEDGTTRRVERSKRVVFRSVSSARTPADTVDWTVKSRWAARVKLSSSATATKYSSWRLSTAPNYRRCR